MSQIAVEELESELILLDDGFQHRQLHRDVDIVLIDATCPFGFGRLLPRGLLREPIASLARADLLIMTRTDQIEESELQSTKGRIQKTLQKQGRSKRGPVIEAIAKQTGLLQYSGEQHELGTVKGQCVFVFCGIGILEILFSPLNDSRLSRWNNWSFRIIIDTNGMTSFRSVAPRNRRERRPFFAPTKILLRLASISWKAFRSTRSYRDRIQIGTRAGRGLPGQD